MSSRRLSALVPTLTALLLVLVLASPAAAATLSQKIATLSNWTQPTAASYSAWNAARLDRAPTASYGFDWSTDYCSDSPDQPLGFDFRIPCWHHDFGYRNYRAVNLYAANKAHVDDAFYYDMRTKCTAYSRFIRPACYSIALTYYLAVVTFGALLVSPADLTGAAAMKAAGMVEARQAAASRAV